MAFSENILPKHHGLAKSGFHLHRELKSNLNPVDLQRGRIVPGSSNLPLSCNLTHQTPFLDDLLVFRAMNKQAIYNSGLI